MSKVQQQHIFKAFLCKYGINVESLSHLKKDCIGLFAYKMKVQIDKELQPINPDYSLQKSFVQKSIRRGQLNDIRTLMIEVLIFSYIRIIDTRLDSSKNEINTSGLKGNITNFVNRILVSLVEDISVGDIFLIHDVIPYLQLLKDSIWYMDAGHLHAALEAMWIVSDRICRVEFRIRLPSFMRAACFDLERCDFLENSNDHSNLLKDYQNETFESLLSKDQSQDEILIPCMKKLFKMIYNRSMICDKKRKNGIVCILNTKVATMKISNLMDKLMDHVKNKLSVRTEDTKNDIETLSQLKTHFECLKYDCLNLCGTVKFTVVAKTKDNNVTFDFGEFWVFLAHFALCCLIFNREQLMQKYKDRNSLKYSFESNHMECFVRNHLKKEYIEVPLYCFDQHVKSTKRIKGLDNQSSKNYFVDQASIVAAENLEFNKHVIECKNVYEKIAKSSYKRNGFVFQQVNKREREEPEKEVHVFDNDWFEDDDLFNDSTLETIEPLLKKMKN